LNNLPDLFKSFFKEKHRYISKMERQSINCYSYNVLISTREEGEFSVNEHYKKKKKISTYTDEC